MVNINLKISNKTGYFLTGLLILLLASAVIYAFDSGNPEIHGHDANEIANIPTGSCEWIQRTTYFSNYTEVMESNATGICIKTGSNLVGIIQSSGGNIGCVSSNIGSVGSNFSYLRC